MSLPQPGGAIFGTGYQSRGQDSPDQMPPFLDQEDFCELRLHSGTHVKSYIDAKAEKGFFLAPNDKVYTCYRRNYLSIGCGYRLDPLAPNDPLYLHRQGRNGPGQAEQVQALAMTLTAAVDGAAGKAVDLVQHTPKRDKGPQSAIRMIRMAPVATSSGQSHLDHHMFGSTQSYPMQMSHNAPQSMPLLPLQTAPDPEEDRASAHHVTTDHGQSSAAFPGPPSPTSTTYTFERIQFKSATANNGKRRAQQQYYHLIIELHADVRQPGAEKPVWVKLAQRTSAPVVVRGRSPSHYSEGHGQAHQSRGTGAGGSGDKGNLPFGWSHGMGGPHMGYSTGGQYHGFGGAGGRFNYHGQGPRAMLNVAPLPMRSLSSVSSNSSISDDEPRAPPEYAYYAEPLVDAGLTSPRARHDISLPSLSSFGFFGADSSRGMYHWSGNGMPVEQAY